MIVTLPRRLKRGMRGRDVLAVQRALARAKYRRWGHFTGRYGKKMGQQMTLFKKHHGIKEEGYGPKTHAKLARYFDRYGASLMLKMGAKLPITRAMIRPRLPRGEGRTRRLHRRLPALHLRLHGGGDGSRRAVGDPDARLAFRLAKACVGGMFARL